MSVCRARQRATGAVLVLVLLNLEVRTRRHHMARAVISLRKKGLSGMDWFDAITGFFLGWFGKKLKRVAEAILDAIWTLVRLPSTLRCFVFMSVYIAILEQLAALRDAGELRGFALKTVRRVVSWASPKMDAWVERAGPGTRAWQKAFPNAAGRARIVQP